MSYLNDIAAMHIAICGRPLKTFETEKFIWP